MRAARSSSRTRTFPEREAGRARLSRVRCVSTSSVAAEQFTAFGWRGGDDRAKRCFIAWEIFEFSVRKAQRQGRLAGAPGRVLKYVAIGDMDQHRFIAGRPG